MLHSVSVVGYLKICAFLVKLRCLKSSSGGVINRVFEGEFECEVGFRSR